MFLSDTLVSITYNEKAGRYTKNGRFISFSEVEGLMSVEQRELEGKLERLTQQMIDGKLTLPDWENQFADTLKRSHIRMTILTQGGQQRTGLSAYAIAGRNLREEYKFLNNFANQLSEGEVSEKQALNRSRLYARSVISTFHEGYHFNRSKEGFTVAKRELSLTANHCKDCPSYVTNGYVSIEKVVPKGRNCQCRGRCRCQVSYGKIINGILVTN